MRSGSLPGAQEELFPSRTHSRISPTTCTALPSASGVLSLLGRPGTATARIPRRPRCSSRD